MLIQDSGAADKHRFSFKEWLQLFPLCILSSEAFCHSCQSFPTLASNPSQWFLKTDFKPWLRGAVSQERFLEDVRLNWWITSTEAWWCSVSLLTSQGQRRSLEWEKANCANSWRLGTNLEEVRSLREERSSMLWLGWKVSFDKRLMCWRLWP